MIEATRTKTAATLTSGSWFGREWLLKIQIGSVCVPGPAMKFVTMIYLVEGQRERE